MSGPLALQADHLEHADVRASRTHVTIAAQKPMEGFYHYTSINLPVEHDPGWKWEQGVAELDGTRHGAAITGLTCSLSFVGTGIRVVGTLEASDKSGQPQTTYEIDGAVVGTYNAPFTPSATTEYNVTFFEIHDLSPGDHSILINNTNGTSPNVFWLDYFLIDLSPQSQIPSPTPFSSAQPSPADTQQTRSIATPDTNAGPTSPNTAAQTQTTKPSGSSSKSHANVGAIAGGVVAGVVGLVAIIAIAVLLFCLRRERRRKAESSIVPFDLAGESLMGSVQHQPPSMRPAPVKHTHSQRSMTEYSSVTTPSDPLPSVLMAVGRRQDVAARSPTSSHPSMNVGSGVGVVPLASNSVNSSHQSASPMTASPHPTPYTPSTSGKDSSSPELTATSQPSTTPLWDSSAGSPISSSPQTTPASAAFPASAPLVPSAADIPPGEWHAPPTMHNRAQALLRSFFSRNSRSGAVPVVHDVDSGLRLYDNVVMPPPYTPD
ncbi:hypothetical protein ONZ51_g4984 [Trametes cubensis]|uniref:Uncharacterized protein n=1 Tax=Trametes cubensis TaxID=1111947 RepID=A0AAD7TUU5_9APHY|nr:hypothetical protein ONZ51_g4984 [Trametes cubensis]